MLFNPNEVHFTVLMFQLNMIRNYTNYQVFSGTYGHHNSLWMTEFNCQWWTDSSVLLFTRKWCFMLCQFLGEITEEFTKNTINKCQSFFKGSFTSSLCPEQLKKYSLLPEISFSEILNTLSNFQWHIKVIYAKSQNVLIF